LLYIYNFAQGVNKWTRGLINKWTRGLINNTLFKIGNYFFLK